MGVTILEDIGNKAGLHEIKHAWFSDNDVELIRAPLPVGDYILMNDAVADVIARKNKRGVALKKMDFLGSYHTSVDTKKDIQEIIGNICGAQHDRFRDEVLLAQNNGIKLYVLVENKDGVKCIDDLLTWDNPRIRMAKWVTTPSGARRRVLKYPNATKGSTLAKAMKTMQDKYGVGFRFCSPEDAGETVLSLLTKQEDESV
jgi:ribosome-associated protein